MHAEKFMSEICNLTFDNAFNPYSDRCEVYDYLDAPQTRRSIMLKIIKVAISKPIDSIWVGRDLGYRGGRRTGLALTDDIHFFNHIERWGLEADRPTKGCLVPERTATVIWSMLSMISNPVFMWNVFPLHPYQAGDQFSNRAHNRKERLVGEELLNILIELLRPEKIIAIGNDANNSLERIVDKNKIVKVRHPSYGGQLDFVNQISKIYGVSR